MKSNETVGLNTTAPVSAQSRMSSTSETNSELGVIKIHDNVLASLVSRAALGVEGVSRLAGSAIIDNLAGMVGSHSRAIDIVKDADNDKLKIVVRLNFKFGAVIPEVAVAVQRAVIEQVERAAGLSVAAVDVVIQQLDDAKPDTAGADSPDDDATRAALASMATLG